MNQIEFKNISKTYPRAENPAVADINLTITAGEKVGLIGANGSGKTTLIRLLLNFVLPDRGSITILGETDLEKTRRYIGHVPERQEGMENFTPRELLRFSLKMAGKGQNFSERIDELLAFAELEDVADNLLSDFSKGMWQRIHIAMALAHHPQILLLDEPMSGLDPEGQKNVREVIAKLKDLTIIYASHNLADVQTFCDSVVILQQGKIAGKVSLENVEKEIFFIDTEIAALKALKTFSDLEIRELRENGNALKIEFLSDAESAQKLIGALNNANIPIKKLRSKGVLENLYHQYVTNTT